MLFTSFLLLLQDYTPTTHIMASPATEKEISPHQDGVEIQTSKDATTGGVVDVDGEGDEEFSKGRRVIIESARAAAAKEQSMTLLQGIKLYPKAIAWSMIISTCIVMEGYDISLVNNFCKTLPSQQLYYKISQSAANIFSRRISSIQ